VRRFASNVAIAGAIGVACAGLLAQTPQTPAPRFTAGTEAVLVDVQVTRNDRAADGLTAADFVVKDSGIVQKASLVAVDRLPVNLLLALDTSASVRGPALDHLKDAARAAVAALRPTDQAALLTFSHSLVQQSDWTADRAQLEKAIAGVTAQGSTSLADAAFVTLASRKKPDTRTLILFFTDGDDTASWLSPADLVLAARRSSAVFFGVTLTPPGPPNTSAIATTMLAAPDGGPYGSRDELEKWFAAEPSLYRGALMPLLALETGGESLQAADTGKLRATFIDIVTRFSQRYLLSFTPTGVPATGWHPLEISVTGGARVSARRGYTR
jgi:VWFA-related protein